MMSKRRITPEQIEELERIEKDEWDEMVKKDHKQALFSFLLKFLPFVDESTQAYKDKWELIDILQYGTKERLTTFIDKVLEEPLKIAKTGGGE